MVKSFFIIFLLCSNVVFAALPPLAQSSREIHAILESSKTYELLGGAEPIEEILHNKSGYLLITTRQQLQVDIHYLPSDKMGPTPFKLEFYTVTPRK